MTFDAFMISVVKRILLDYLNKPLTKEEIDKIIVRIIDEGKQLTQTVNKNMDEQTRAVLEGNKRLAENARDQNKMNFGF